MISIFTWVCIAMSGTGIMYQANGRTQFEAEEQAVNSCEVTYSRCEIFTCRIIREEMK